VLKCKYDEMKEKNYFFVYEPRKWINDFSKYLFFAGFSYKFKVYNTYLLKNCYFTPK